jgi:hypothetical protein
MTSVRDLVLATAAGVDEPVGSVLDRLDLAVLAAHPVLRQKSCSLIEGLLDLDIVEVVVSAWSRERVIEEAKERTASDPMNREAHVPMLEHTITYELGGDVVLSVEGVGATEVRLPLRLVVHVVVRGLELHVAWGRVVAVRAASADAGAHLQISGVPVGDPVSRTVTLDARLEVDSSGKWRMPTVGASSGEGDIK